MILAHLDHPAVFEDFYLARFVALIVQLGIDEARLVFVVVYPLKSYVGRVHHFTSAGISTPLKPDPSLA